MKELVIMASSLAAVLILFAGTVALYPRVWCNRGGNGSIWGYVQPRKGNRGIRSLCRFVS